MNGRGPCLLVVALSLGVAGPARSSAPVGSDRGPLPRQIVFVIDTSGSISAISIEQARQVLLGLEWLAPINACEAAPATIALDGKVDASTVQELIAVAAESPLLDERQISTGATISQTDLEEIPSTHDSGALLQTPPGVLTDRIDVGGTATGEQSLYTGPGSTKAQANQATWLVDGVALADMAALGSSTANYDLDAFEEMQVSTVGSDPTLGSDGVVLDMTTKRGTNEWRGTGRFLLADEGWRSETHLSSSDLGRPGPWNRDAAHPDGSTQETIERSNRIVKLADFGAEIGGPIARDRLWAWGSHGIERADLLTFAGPPVSTDIVTRNVKLDAQLAASNSATLFALDSDERRVGGNAGPFRPQETTWNESRVGGVPTAAKIEDTHVVSSRLFLTGWYSKLDSGVERRPRGGPDRTASLDSQGRWHHTFAWRQTQRSQEQLAMTGSWFLDSGHVSHELKLGAGYRRAETRSRSRWGGAGYSIWLEYPGGAHDVLYAARGASSAAVNTYRGVYLQDTASVGRLTANVGLRYDLQRGGLRDGSVSANPRFPDLLPAATYDGGDPGFEWKSIVPRLGLTYAVGAERKTLLRASYSRFADQLGIGATGHLNPLAEPSYVYLVLSDARVPGGNITRADVVDRNGDGVVDLGDSVGFGGAYDPIGRGLLQNNGVDPGLDPQITDELLASAEHALRPELVVGLELTYRKLTGLLERELLVFDGDPYAAESLAHIGRLHTRADYVPVSVSRPGGLPDGRDASFTYWQLRPGVTSRGGTFLENGDREQEYRGASLTFHKRVSHGWMLRGLLTWSDWSWRVPESELEDPTRLLGGGFDGEPVLQGSSTGVGSKAAVYVNSSWSYSVDALYQVAPARRWGFDLAVHARGRQGYPLPYYERLVLGDRNGIPGLTYVQVVGNDAFRLDDIHLIDAGIDKELTFGDLGLTLAIDCFNVLNEGFVLQRNNRLRVGAGETDPQALASGFVTEVVGPRIFRVGLRVSFR